MEDKVAYADVILALKNAGTSFSMTVSTEIIA